MRRVLLSSAAFVFALAAACSSSSSRSGFEEDPGTQPAAGFGDAPGLSGPTAKPTECAKAEAEAVRPPVDVIVSVDQSGSMSDDIANVKANINQLAAFLQKTGLDYRVVMIGTVGSGSFDICVPPPLGGASCQSNGTTFRTVNRNVQSNDTLDIIISTLGQTTGAMAWRDFLRPESLKVFIPITDDDSYYLTASSFDQQLLAIPGGLFGAAGARKYVFYPITGAAAFPSESTCGSNAVNNGKTYIDLAKKSGGKWFPICATNFAPVFEEIGKNVASTVACELAIPKPAGDTEIDLGRVNVKVTPPSGTPQDVLQDSSTTCADGANGWQYDASKTKILLCGDACAAARGDTGTKGIEGKGGARPRSSSAKSACARKLRARDAVQVRQRVDVPWAYARYAKCIRTRSMSTSSNVEPSAITHLSPSSRMRVKFFRELVALGLPQRKGTSGPVTESDLAALPAPAQRYMRFMGVLGRPRDWSFCARWDARFRMAPDKPWMPCEVWQYNTSLEVTRVFHMRMRMAGLVPTYVRDLYVDGGGRMLGKLFDKIAIADDKSEKVTIGELVTYVNDALMFAPSMLLGPTTIWTPIDDTTFDVTMSDHGTTVTGRVIVGADGAMKDFATTDRFGEDPANRKAGMVRARWSTPVDGWTIVNGRPRPTEARAVWHYPSGDFCYVELTTDKMDLAFDVAPGSCVSS